MVEGMVPLASLPVVRGVAGISGVAPLVTPARGQRPLPRGKCDSECLEKQ